MRITFRKRPIETTTELLNSLMEVKVKSVDIIQATPTYISISMLNLSKKDIKELINAGYKETEIAKNKKILVFNGE